VVQLAVVFILYAVVAGIVAGLLLGGRLDGLAELSFRWVWAALLGLAAQVVLFSDAGSRAAGDAAPALYVGSTALVLAFVLRNARVAGMPIVALGAVSNLVTITANGGTMPASRGALEAAGLSGTPGFTNSRELATPLLAPLGDVLALPAGMPFANVFSVGDVLIGVGVLVVIVAAMRRGPRPSVAADPGGAPVAPTEPPPREVPAARPEPPSAPPA
jgi:hypothetical protein